MEQDDWILLVNDQYGMRRVSYELSTNEWFVSLFHWILWLCGNWKSWILFHLLTQKIRTYYFEERRECTRPFLIHRFVRTIGRYCTWEQYKNADHKREDTPDSCLLINPLCTPRVSWELCYLVLRNMTYQLLNLSFKVEICTILLILCSFLVQINPFAYYIYLDSLKVMSFQTFLYAILVKSTTPIVFAVSKAATCMHRRWRKHRPTDWRCVRNVR